MDASNAPKTSGARIGRQPSISHAELSHISLQLFIENGFENTTVDAVAIAAGIGRRTLFRYFPSKNDLPWGDFDAGLEQMRSFLRMLPSDTPLVEALSLAVVEFNRFPAEEIPFHRERMDLLLNVPALVAHSTLRYAAWRQVVADYAALRLGIESDNLEPQTIAWAFLGASLAAYEQWLKHEDADLLELLEAAFVVLRTVFASLEIHPAG
ncbi:mycofactocin system transcriptional regulator [Glaciihabitans sp. UYNi722]|uniref:mycofactocin system transcriptional regulator n=1 Tax=Glaciihabitans sp. UYNi722 TaxID=3156344 RepID=UPI00339A2C44